MKGQLLMLLRQYRILLKRTSKKFINLLLLLIIPFTAFYVKNLPMEEKSTVFICGYYMEESNSYLAQVEQELSGHQDCFTFEKCSSMEELKDQDTGSCEIFKISRTRSTGISITSAISSGCGSLPSSCNNCLDTRISLLIVSTI